MLKKLTILISIFFLTFVCLKSQDLASLLKRINIDSLIYNVEILSGEREVIINDKPVRIDSRKFDSEKKHLAALWLKSKLESFGYNTEIIELAKNEETVVARKIGSNPDNLVIIGAHYDSFNYEPGPAPGANDNASGCSAVLEIARILKDVELNFSLEFIFWDGEETGMASSKSYVDNLVNSNYFLIGYLNLDMLAWDSNNDGKVRVKYKNFGNSYSLAQQSMGWASNYKLNLQPELVTNSWWGDGDCDSFWKKGLTSIGIADYLDYFDSMHNSYDLIKNFNYDYFLENSKFAFIITYKLAVGENLSVNPEEVLKKEKNNFIKATKNEIIELVKQKNITDFEIFNVLGIKINQNNVNDLPEGIYFIR
ncbi:MAG: M28 family metallopeptidase [Candidatus Kapabacteria bacterium]|nr:M28 family metallopeptidase [Candidatus Kapabacteria bacterium]